MEMGVGKDYQIPDELWAKIKSLLPPLKQREKLGRPRMDDRKAMTAIFFILRRLSVESFAKVF